MNKRMSSLKVFKKPHHSSTLSLRGLFHSVLVTIAVISLAYLLRPFGLKTVEPAAWANILVTLGALTFLAMLLAQFILPMIIKDFYQEEKWTTGKQFTQWIIMSALISISTIYYLSTRQLASFPLDALVLFGNTILPLAIASVIHQNYLNNKFDRLAKEKNEDILRKEVVLSENPLNILAFRSTGEKLNLIPNQLIYIKIGTPSDFYYQNFMGVEKSSMHISKEEIIKELQGHPQFEIFQGEYIININAIAQISGSARGYEVQIARLNELLKVSHKDRKKIERL
jgi:hypothetical protein